MELVAAILGGSALDLDVDQIADAIWLSQFLTGHERQAPRVAGTEQGIRSETGPVGDAQAPRLPKGDDGAGTDPDPAPSTVDVERAPPAGTAATRAARFRSPAASALTQQLELARALRPLAWRSPRPGAWRVVEDVTADCIARTGLWLAELEPETDPALDLAIVVDASPRLHVWQRITRELIDVMRSSSAFRTTTIWRVAGDQPEVAVERVVLRAAGGAVRVGGHSVVDAARATAMLVISDFAGALWSSEAGLACLRLWSRCMMVALVSLVPQRSWGRSLLGTLPATRLTAVRRGAPSAALGSEAAVLAGAIPVPVISIDPASFGTWARLVAGRAQARARGVLVLPDVSVEARARYAAAAIHGGRSGSSDHLVAEIAEAIRASQGADEPRDARERVERFRRTHRPEVVELAAALISAPLELSVMLVVQRAVAPRTGTLELAEIIDSGLFEIEPPQPGDDEVRFRISDDVRDHLSPSVSIGDHLRVLEAVGAYLRDHLGSSIDFEAMVVHPTRPMGPVAEGDRRFARMFIAELRRLGIDTAALGPPPEAALRAAELPVLPRTHYLDQVALMSRVCKVKRSWDVEHANTGFLIAPDLILTAWQGKSTDEQISSGITYEFDGGAVTACTTAADAVLRLAFSPETELVMVRITPSLGEDRGWFDLLWPASASRGDIVRLIGASQASGPRLYQAHVAELDDSTVTYDLDDLDADTLGTSGGPVVDELGRLVAVHYRRGLGPAARRRGIAASWIACHPVMREFLDGAIQGNIDLLERLAVRYDRLQEQEQSDARTLNLDRLVEQMVQAAGSLAADAAHDVARSIWLRASGGARVVALAICLAHPVTASIEIIVGGVDEPPSAHEQRTALQALLCVVADRHPLDTDPAIAAIVRRLRAKDGFGGDRTALARQVLRRYLQRCTLSTSLALADRLDLVDEWLRGGAPLPIDKRDLVETVVRGDEIAGAPCIAFIGGVAESPWQYGDLAEALGRELTRLGWKVVAAAGREVGIRAIVGARRAGSTTRLSQDGGDVILDPADCVIAMAGGAVTAREYELARGRKLPVLALAFTGGVAGSVASEADRGLVERDVPLDLLSPLERPQVTDEAARLIARVAGVVIARTRSQSSAKGRSRIREQHVSRARGISILLLTADSSDSTWFNLSHESDAIEDELKRSDAPGRFEFHVRWGVSPHELTRQLVELCPTIIHFSGHGGAETSEAAAAPVAPRRRDVPDELPETAGDGGIYLPDERGKPQLVTTGELAKLLESRPEARAPGGGGIHLQDEQGAPQLVTAPALAMIIGSAAAATRVVVLNGCYSEVLAEALCDVVDCVVGTTGAIGDDAARAFVARFYGALGHHRSVGDAFDQAVATLAAKQLRDEYLPRCRTRAGIDAHQLYLDARPEVSS